MMEITIPALYAIFRDHSQISTDTRNIVPGSLFFALKGEHFNGNAFAAAALDKGAAYAIVDEPAYRSGDRCLQVPGALEALQQLARYHRRQLSIPFIAITGSNGKTTTKELVHAVLSTTFRTACTAGNLNNHIGVPLTLLSVSADHQMAVVEMGANHLHEIEFLCSLAEPTHGLITNIGKAHLEGFGGIEGVKKGKGELYTWLKEHEGVIFLHEDQPFLHELLNRYPSFRTYGSGPSCDISGEIPAQEAFLTFTWRNKSGFRSGPVQTRLTGTYNLPNVLAAACVGDFFGVPPEQISRAIAGYLPGNQRSQVLQSGTNTIVLDAYNANPSSMEAALRNFSRNYPGDKLVVLGDMLELGEESHREHAGIAALIGQLGFREVVLVGQQFLAGAAPPMAHFFLTSEEARDWIRSRNFRNMNILIKGSRGLKMEKTLEAFSG